MTSQEKLIRFMEGKANLLSEALGVPSTLYFNEDDEECLRQLSDQHASSVWRMLELAIYVEGAYGLTMAVCPFCLASRFNCSECCYAKHHGKCGIGGDDYIRVIDELLTKNNSPQELFTNEFYANLLKSIEKEESKCTNC